MNNRFSKTFLNDELFVHFPKVPVLIFRSLEQNRLGGGGGGGYSGDGDDGQYRPGGGGGGGFGGYRY